ncbi:MULTISPECIES: FmdB family zinc ribbon protein [unclassified Modestobacter]|uniref:FmdB family zinc ribbon protein n=1 Tax=unclassified Modestobacter TaxID=2643866 RepID=UPI0022AA6468|nr:MULTISPECIES: FmdB family zinc ribbon protein [unclassified Modestobacter]MCZ2825208.1 FmdB family transcriptional regulator [Modestobacter sp. VKM Ac-2981]MCZ2853727.1 FmdB family transcriptional regulator [Modestobacter sp. VKM Ac-2982]
MPTYQYACTNPEVKHEFEVVQSFTDPAVATCTECEAPVRKVYGSVGVVFKGSGFYRTDSRKGEGASTGSGAKDSSGSKESSSNKDSSSKDSGGSKESSSTKDSGSKASSTASSSSSSSSSGSGGKAAN